MNSSDEAYRFLLVRYPITGNMSDLGLTKYAGDTKRIHVMVTGTKEKIEARIKCSAVILDEEPLGGGCAQNQSKKDAATSRDAPMVFQGV